MKQYSPKVHKQHVVVSRPLIFVVVFLPTLKVENKFENDTKRNKNISRMAARFAGFLPVSGRKISS